MDRKEELMSFIQATREDIEKIEKQIDKAFSYGRRYYSLPAYIIRNKRADVKEMKRELERISKLAETDMESAVEELYKFYSKWKRYFGQSAREIMLAWLDDIAIGLLGGR